MKHKLKRLGVRAYRYDAEQGKVVEVFGAHRHTREAPSVIIFKEEYYEHIDGHPIWITSKKQLREECEKRGMYAKALD